MKKRDESSVKIPAALVRSFDKEVRVIIRDKSPWGLNPLGLDQLKDTALMQELLKAGDIVFIPKT